MSIQQLMIFKDSTDNTTQAFVMHMLIRRKQCLRTIANKQLFYEH